MTNARLIDEVFTAALDVAAEDRDTLIRDRCGDDEAAICRVLALLESAVRPSGLIEDRFDAIRNRLWQAMLSDEPDPEEDLSGRLIGAWSVQERIARGGLATVYKAQRSDGTYQQEAAFKVLRRGLDTDDLVTRFRTERQILSSLEHPGIAAIFDGGALDDGRPYLVLEYVNGLPIDRYCDENKLDTRQRVKLMISVSRAIHHAHQRQVVHRDIKPSNMLVTRDGDVRLLDFGIAKLLDPLALPAVAPLTRVGESLLTPAYASPEQKAGDVITTASDIYQLGQVLSELLSGRKPGDLDAIVKKAMHTDPDRRYASADELVADLERYLDGLPVLARPDTIGYRLLKLNKRQPWLLPGLAVILIVVIGYTVMLTRYTERLEKEQRLSAATQAFLIGLFESPDPFAPADTRLGRDISVVDALDIGQRRLRMELTSQPELRASLLSTISDVYRSLDVSDTSIALREEALPLERELYGSRSPQVVASLQALGALYTERGDVERGSELLDEQLSIASRIFDPDDPELGVAEIASGHHANFIGEHELSRTLLQRGANRLRNASDDYARQRISALIGLANRYDLEDSERSYDAIDEAFKVATRVFGEQSLQTASARIRLASTMTSFGDYDESEKNFLLAIPVLESQLGENHDVTLAAMNNLGFLYHTRGDLPKAEAVHRKILERFLNSNGRYNRNTGDSYQNLAGAITQQGRYDESIPLHRDAYEIYKTVLNDNHYLIAFPLLSISYANLMRGEGAAAELSAREALERLQATVPNSLLEGVAQCLVGLSLEQQGMTEEGEALVAGSHHLIAKGYAPDPYPALCRMPVQ